MEPAMTALPAALKAPRFRTAITIACAAAILSSCAMLPGFREGQRNYATSVTWNDTSWCVPWRLKRVLGRVSRQYGPVTVHSTHRWPMENKLKGGKPKSYHLRCRAVDFSVSTYGGDITGYLKSQGEVGGFSRYPQGFYHIDTGPRRTW
jgi:uncharacterized protein YcbK (DUF882 family)